MKFELSVEQCINLRELANEYIANNESDYKKWLKEKKDDSKRDV